MIGVPKTIDNDLSGTDLCFGFDTAVSIATEAIDRVHTTAEAHNRVIVVEVMGRDAGWIAIYSGVAGGADVILIPEHPLISTMLRRCLPAAMRVAVTSALWWWLKEPSFQEDRPLPWSAEKPMSLGTFGWAASATGSGDREPHRL